MIHNIADSIAETIKDNLSWADLCVGLVREVNTKKTNGEDNVIPVYFNRNWGDCNMSDYLTVIPDGSKKSIIYMDILSEPDVVSVDARGGVSFEAGLNLVVWYNANKIDYNIVESDVLLSEVIGVLPKKLATTGCYGVYIDVTGARVRDTAVFDKYDYNEAQQYLMYPYDFFVINLNVSYTIPKGCVSSDSNAVVCPTKPDKPE